MEFRKFSSIENHYREKIIQSLVDNGFSDIQWILTEKIHGANFSFWYDGEEFKVASRNQFVDSTFYSCGSVIEKYKESVISFYDQLCGKGNVLTIYGELYGPSIQKGIKYGSEKDFVMFDFMVDGVRFIPQFVFSNHVKELLGNIKTVPVLGIVDSLQEVVDFNNEFISVLGTNNGVDCEDNFAEGFVAIPYLDVGNYSEGRAIIKSKATRWAEKAKQPKRKRKDQIVEYKNTELINEYVNTNRLDSVVSKLGEITNDDFGLLIKEYCNDVMEDMIKDGVVPVDWKDHEDFSTIGKEMVKIVAPFLRENILNKL